MSDPANVLALDDIQMMTGLNCRVAVAAEEDIEALISRLNTLESAVTEAVEDEDEEDRDSAELTELRESADDAPVIKLVYSILGQAVDRGRVRHPLRARARATCGSASASTASSTRSRACRSGWSPASSRASRS